MKNTFSLAAIVLCLAEILSAGLCRAADEPTATSATSDSASSSESVPQADLVARLAKLVADLDAERFAVREEAARQLDELAADPALSATVGVELRRTMLDPAISFEVRSRLEPILVRLAPLATGAKPDDTPGDPATSTPSAEEIERLVGALTDDEYGVRVGAVSRLDWLLAQPQAVAPIFAALKRRMSDPELSEMARREITPVLERARGAWLLGDAGETSQRKVTEAEISSWLDVLSAAPSPQDKEARRRVQLQTAERELLDLLARDEYSATLERALSERLKQPGLSDEAIRRLENLAHWTKPALVAEFWFVDPTAGDTNTGGLRHGGVQYLLVDVPSLGEGAERPSHFDRIDDRVAHCVSGNALSEGEYPVGVLFPHPQQEGAFFHLVNLPTPRRRMAYEYELRRDEEQRARELSRRTLAAIANRKEPLTPSETLMLGAVDREELSRFVGPYFETVDDAPFSVELPSNTPSGQTSRHGLVCLMLAERGTPTAIPSLMKAIENKRFLPPTAGGPCDMPWIAALAIASRVRERSEWPEVDGWLADLLERTDPLVLPRKNVRADEVNSEDDAPEIGDLYPDLGATAAAILLRRHGIAPSVYALEPIGRQLLAQVGCPGHRFTQPSDRQALVEWWNERHTAPTTTRAASAAPRR